MSRWRTFCVSEFDLMRSTAAIAKDCQTLLLMTHLCLALFTEDPPSRLRERLCALARCACGLHGVSSTSKQRQARFGAASQLARLGKDETLVLAQSARVAAGGSLARGFRRQLHGTGFNEGPRLEGSAHAKCPGKQECSGYGVHPWSVGLRVSWCGRRPLILSLLTYSRQPCS